MENVKRTRDMYNFVFESLFDKEDTGYAEFGVDYHPEHPDSYKKEE